MTDTVPAAIAWPLIIFTTVMAAFRYKWVNTSPYDKYFNNTLVWMLGTVLLRQRAVEQLLAQSALLSVTCAQELSMVGMVGASTEFMGFVSMWSSRSPEHTRRRQRQYRLAATVLSIAFLVFATRARTHAQLLEVSGGWDGVAALFAQSTMLVALGVRVILMAASEGRRPTAHPRERHLALVGVVLGCAITASTLQAAVLEFAQQMHWADTVRWRLFNHGFVFFWVTVVATCLAGVPVALRVIGHFGWDRASRDCRNLATLRHDMVAAVPEVAFELINPSTGRRRTRLELHQTTVQIRDALLQLRHYFRDHDPDQIDDFCRLWRVPAQRRSEAELALDLAYAVRAKSAGAQPVPIDVSAVFTSRPTTLEEEATDLVKLSTWWPLAQAAARPAHADDTKVDTIS
ncbi:hypothetical protein OQ968_02735 [Mycobacterium sp. 663a-19]|uniref:DUF6545 domain-containing protein n=1 Tax=Mycobacterium sp. 663a-19 TaxID=2986148 RepID=UPI002D1E6C0C|nr:DUF6545 domain-containing protein [Mycobacterium sp. 663a-19]MEB3980176.1 hypothetical protein [Mycobacterium sp. 663a-19]